MGQPLCCSAADTGMWGQRSYGDGSTYYVWLSNIILLPWLPGFPPQAFPTSLLPHLLLAHLSTVNTSSCLGIAPQTLSSGSQLLCLLGTCIPVQSTYGHGRDCLILIPLRLPQISWFPLSPKCFSSDSDNCPSVGIGPLLRFPHPPRAGSVLVTLLFFPSSFILPSCAWVYMFFSADEVLLSTLSWSSACTSVSEGIFLMYPWREMYFTSTYSSIIFFSPQIMSRSLS